MDFYFLIFRPVLLFFLAWKDNFEKIEVSNSYPGVFAHSWVRTWLLCLVLWKHLLHPSVTLHLAERATPERLFLAPLLRSQAADTLPVSKKEITKAEEHTASSTPRAFRLPAGDTLTQAKQTKCVRNSLLPLIPSWCFFSLISVQSALNLDEGFAHYTHFLAARGVFSK